jgi:hypothetical protein
MSSSNIPERAQYLIAMDCMDVVGQTVRVSVLTGSRGYTVYHSTIYYAN